MDKQGWWAERISGKRSLGLREKKEGKREGHAQGSPATQLSDSETWSRTLRRKEKLKKAPISAIDEKTIIYIINGSGVLVLQEATCLLIEYLNN